MVEQEEEIILRLSRREAGALMAVCKRIGGEQSGPRGIFSSKSDSILTLLEQQEITVPDDVRVSDINNRAIYFL